ncbi:DsbA family protein [Corynebacterium lujinxingii]|uniref:Thioredoxin domain-containing protein n=1 Tax=Corynebacterium lujinxingii TaxID=2763010 RepID=A0A7H0JXW5_9CORY|nr:thioredoxin domain-containing protein [Corynebacterium lujinxingii]MBC3179831.1 thioredoxin domain-containing protein [Corynebacterium lujinxingii]NNO11692.1 thioredoxin domain-containing protein [Corynebacterium lujinxingii]QNP89881.1 thioredoxin domain-containing protein [Corynebacterium lujinxingii]
MTTRKVQNPNEKGSKAFIWAILAVVAIALLVIGIIIYNGKENRSAAMQEEMVDVTGLNVEWNQDEDIIHLTGDNNDDANSAELFEDFSCSYCAKLHLATGDQALEKIKAGEINVDLRPMNALDQGEEGHSTRALAAELAMFANGDISSALTMRNYLFENQQSAYNKYDNDGFADLAADYGAGDQAVQDIRDGKFIDTAKRMGDNNRKFQEDETGEAWTPRVLVDGKDIEDIAGERDNWPQELADM